RTTATRVVTVGFGKPGICVDVHVHRISNRWGYVHTRTPSDTETALRARLPRRYWIGYNDLLVAFGQNVCLPVSPRCSQCPIERACPRIGVTRSRCPSTGVRPRPVGHRPIAVRHPAPARAARALRAAGRAAA
ncbi:MAG TPA: hypothetical protein VML54_17465, partial [Candidatus Limnocylindrales bacterium]|nr:hypothetical protein [Candidatus Limnocylindrales bacterium]